MMGSREINELLNRDQRCCGQRLKREKKKKKTLVSFHYWLNTRLVSVLYRTKLRKLEYHCEWDRHKLSKKHHRKWGPRHVPVQFQPYVCTKTFYQKYCNFCAILQPKLRKNKVANTVSVQDINLLKRVDYEWLNEDPDTCMFQQCVACEFHMQDSDYVYIG